MWRFFWRWTGLRRPAAGGPALAPAALHHFDEPSLPAQPQGLRVPNDLAMSLGIGVAAPRIAEPA